MTWFSIIVIIIALASATLSWLAIQSNRRTAALVEWWSETDERQRKQGVIQQKYRLQFDPDAPVKLRAGDKVEAVGRTWRITEIAARGQTRAVIQLQPLGQKPTLAPSPEDWMP